MTTKKTGATSEKKTPARKPAAGLPARNLPEPAPKKSKKEPRVEVVRDSFTMPQDEYRKIAEIKKTCLEQGLHVKKSEVLRAGLQALAKLGTTRLKAALGGLRKIKTGRPKKH